MAMAMQRSIHPSSSLAGEKCLMDHRKTFCSKLLTLPDCPISPLGYSCFSLILAGRLPAVATEGPTTNVLNIAQTA
jgi:hypothetical protein